MDTMNGKPEPETKEPTEEPENTEQESNVVKGILDPNSYDTDTPSIIRGGKRHPLRISGVDGPEMGTAGGAEEQTAAMFGIFGGSETEETVEGTGVFSRNIGALKVEGLDWRMMLHEIGVSDNWGKYGFDKLGSEENERYKYYAGQSQSTNLDAYRLLASDVEPNTIISDEDFKRVQMLRQSFKTHVNDSAEGVLDSKEAKTIAHELFGNPDLLAAAQKRQWYGEARYSRAGSIMLSKWNDPYSRSIMIEGDRKQTIDVYPKEVETSYWGMAKNAISQQFGDMTLRGKTNHGSQVRSILGENTESDIDQYIRDNDIAPDVAAVLYDDYEKHGFRAAVQKENKEQTHQETIKQKAEVEKEFGLKYAAMLLTNEALPYLVDPVGLIGGAGLGKAALNISVAKIGSPMVQKIVKSGLVGGGTGLGESFVFTSRNYKEFTPQELMTTWAMDAGMGAAFGTFFTLAKSGVQRFGKGALDDVRGEGLEDMDFTPTEAEVRNEIARKESKTAAGKVEKQKQVDRDKAWDDELKTKLKSEGESESKIKTILQRVKIKRTQTRREKGLDTTEYKNEPELKPQTPVKDSFDEDLERAIEEEFMFKERENTVQKQEDDAYLEFVLESQNRMRELTESVSKDVNNGEVDSIIGQIDVEPPPKLPKPEPIKPEPVDGKIVDDAVEEVDTRTPEEIETAEAEWQDATVKLTLKHHGDVVRPEIERVNKSHNFIAKVVKAAGKGIGLQEFASRMISSKDNITSFIGNRILESGTGYAGKMKYKASGALIKDTIYTRNAAPLNETYVDQMKGWVMSGGIGKYKAFKAAWEGGAANKLAREFHKEVFKYQEALQMGKAVNPNEFVERYVKRLNKVNDELFEGRIEANVKGFSKDRRIKNYIPHIWKKVKVAEIVKRGGEKRVIKLIEKSIESAKHAGKIADDKSTSELAKQQFDWINGLGDSLEHVDDVGAGTSGRGKSRIPLDFTTEHEGLSMLDLIDTDVPTIMDSYIQRAAADIGISESTGGLIRSEGDFEKFLTPKSKADQLLAQDTKDLMYGRPTRGGMSPEIRSMMDLVSTQQMGGIGIAQMAETGTMAQRLVVSTISQPKMARKIWAMARQDVNDRSLLAQVRSIAAVSDSMPYLHRQSVNNIDQAQVDELSEFKAASMKAVDKATLGAYKAQFSRLLGSLSGNNAIQVAQSRLLQSSFSIDVARSAKYNKGTSTIQRLTDLGLDQDGPTFENIRQHVEFDEEGFPSDFNFEKWDKKALNTFAYAMNKEEAQLMPRVMAGELPVLMNGPHMQAILQFRKTPLAFMSKGMQRNLQFADREAALGTVLNAITAGLTRYAKMALAGGAYVALSDAEFQQPTMDQMQPYNYVSNFGILGDMYSLTQSWSKAYQQNEGVSALWEGAKAVPIVSSVDSAYHAAQGDPVAIKKSMPLNTLPFVNEIVSAYLRWVEEDDN
jgi:hypothetical protein